MKICVGSKKIYCIITAVLMIISLFSGCEGNKNDTDETIAEKHFKAVTMDIDEKYQLDNMIFKNGYFYSVYSDFQIKKDENGGDVYYTDRYISILDETGKTIKEILVCKQETPDIVPRIIGNYVMVDDSKNMTVLIENGMSYVLRTFDNSGNIISEKDLSDRLSGASDMICDGEGNIFVNVNNSFNVFDKDGNFIFATDKLESLNSYVSGLILTNTETAAVVSASVGENAHLSIVELDVDAKNFGAEHILSDVFANSLYSGSGEYLCYLQGDTGIIGIRADNFEKEMVISLLDIGIDTSQITEFISCGDGSFVTGGYTHSTQKDGFVCSRIIPADEKNSKKILTLGCFSMNGFWRTAIAEFNRKSENHIIKAVSYSDGNNGVMNDRDNALNNFNIEIISGNIPDILILDSDMPYDNYANKGLFADIYELMDSDPEYNRDKFMPNVISALERDGKLYGLAVLREKRPGLSAMRKTRWRRM